MRLVACGSRKATEERPAQDLYTGGLFRAARAWAEQSPDGLWGIVSAKHGILLPTTPLAPYNHTADMGSIARAVGRGIRLAVGTPLEVAAPERYYRAIRLHYPGALWMFAELPDKRMGYQRHWLLGHTL